MKPSPIAAILLLSAVAGCGGNNNNASPFGGTNNTNSLPDRSGVTSARPTVRSGSIPVFLTVKPESLTKDLWIQLNGVEVQSGKGSQSLYRPTIPWLRLSALRDAAGQRYFFVGMAERTEPWVRLQVNLGEKYRFTEVGDDKPTNEPFGGETTTNGKGDRLLTLNLDPNAEFKDALVAELNLETADDKLVPKLALANADTARQPDRQERRIWSGTAQIGQAESGARSFRLKEAGKALFATGPETFAGQETSPLSAGAKVIAWTYFDGHRNQIAASAVLPESDAILWVGKVLAYTPEKGSLMIEASQASSAWDGTNSPIFQMPKGAWTAPAASGGPGQPLPDEWVIVGATVKEGGWVATWVRPAAKITISPTQPPKTTPAKEPTKKAADEKKDKS